MSWVSYSHAAAQSIDSTTPVPTEQKDQLSNNGLNKGWYAQSFSGVDFWGGDILPTRIEVDDESQCALACANQEKCRFYTFNIRQKRCFLKADYYLSLYWEGANSGVLYEADSANEAVANAPSIETQLTCQQNTDTLGMYELWHQSPAKTLGSCLLNCLEANACQYVAYGSRFGACVFRRLDFYVAGYQHRKGAVSCQKQGGKAAPLTDPAFIGDRTFE